MPSYPKNTQSSSQKNKHCPKCKLDLPIQSFSSTRAKFCNSCKRIVHLEQKQAMTERALARSQTKKQKKEVVISLSDLKKAVQKEVNKYCRMRDINDGCISCDGPADQGGHYIAQGSSSFLRFNLDNINGQCVNCNHWKSGNYIEYRIRLVNKIGLERVEWLEAHRHDKKKWTREELYEIREHVKNLSKQLITEKG